MPKKLKDGIYIINFDEDADIGAHEKVIGHKNIKTNIFRVPANKSIVCGCFCIGFVDFMFVGKTLIDFTCLFSPYDFEKNNNITLSCFKNE